MAVAWLDRYECDREGELPPVCLKCGAEAEHYVKRTFQWYPPWVLATMLAGLIPWMVLAAVLTKKMTVYAPLCRQHRSYFTMRMLWGGLIILVGLVMTVGGIYLSVIIMAVQAKANNSPLVTFSPCCATVFLFCVAMLVASVVMQMGIKPAEITEDDIKLKGVSDEFVEAVKEDRRGRKGAFDRRRAGRDAEDD
jgi:hypothetical protein